ncbi:MAG: DUF4417 domain-containing protein, partial [Olsenella sp.]
DQNGSAKINREEYRHIKRKMRRHQRDVFHARMVDGATFVGAMDLPAMDAVSLYGVGKVRLIPFSEAVKSTCTDYDAIVDCYEDDYQFERLWNNPLRYLSRLRLFAGVIEPDFSTCRDFPVALKAYNTYRNQALGYFLQRNGILCVPNVRCEPGLPWMLDGTPRRSAIAIGARAAVKKPSDRKALVSAVRYAVESLVPTEIIWYGSISYGIGDWLFSLGVPVHVCPARIRG